MKALALLATVGPMDGSEETAAKSDDRAAFDLLMRQHERLVLVTALRLLGRLEDAQDASQTVNVCHDAGRKRRVSGPVEDAGELPAPAADPQRAAIATERRRALEMSLRMLSENLWRRRTSRPCARG
jgi:DNA-directed RNA polymerase specialized sigma24 family protein